MFILASKQPPATGFPEPPGSVSMLSKGREFAPSGKCPAQQHALHITHKARSPALRLLSSATSKITSLFSVDDFDNRKRATLKKMCHRRVGSISYSSLICSVGRQDVHSVVELRIASRACTRSPCCAHHPPVSAQHQKRYERVDVEMSTRVCCSRW